MQSFLKIALDVAILLVVVLTSIYVYRVYGDRIAAFFRGDEDVIIFIENLAVSVTIADEPDEQRQGLSGVSSLGELEGKLFIFENEEYHRIWMKDMLFPIDILFINNEFEIVHIEENVLPESYPLTYTSDEPARFVLETNAFFAQSFSITEGARVLIPPRYLPPDLRESLRE